MRGGIIVLVVMLGILAGYASTLPAWPGAPVYGFSALVGMFLAAHAFKAPR